MICPFCQEEIKDGAIKCKHCGSMLTEPSPTAPAPVRDPGEMIGYLMLIVPAISILLIWLWVGQMNLLQSPASTLSLLGIATLFGTAVLAAFEANQLGFGRPDPKTGKRSETGPLGYFLGMLALWILVYPIYLYQRSKKGKKNLVVGGILLAVIFALSWYFMYSTIAERIAEIQSIF